MSEEERQAIIHLLDKQARYEYCIKNNISFSDEDYEAYIIRQSMINKDKEIERLNNNINKAIEAINVYQNEKTLSIRYQDLNRIRGILRGNEFDLKIFEEYLKELKGSDKE